MATTPVLLPGKSHGRRSLIGCSPWGRKESDTTERRHFHFHYFNSVQSCPSLCLEHQAEEAQTPPGEFIVCSTPNLNAL